MRVHIAKALQTHCSAIKNAVDEYNSVAAPLGRRTLDWSEVSHVRYIEEFALLRETRPEVSEKPWISNSGRLALQKYRRIKRAREEITRLNVEVRRLHTTILDESITMNQVLARLREEASPILVAAQSSSSCSVLTMQPRASVTLI